jgi:hypothetical protein
MPRFYTVRRAFLRKGRQMPTVQVQVKPAYSVREFCAEFGICRTQLYVELRAGRLPYFKVGSRTRIRGADGLRWLEAQPNGKAA